MSRQDISGRLSGLNLDLELEFESTQLMQKDSLDMTELEEIPVTQFQIEQMLLSN